jgi:hypothetical protein
MVKVWYEPPPGGPRTHLNRGGYYVESARTPAFITKLNKARPITVVVPAIAAIAAICYIPLSKYRTYFRFTEGESKRRDRCVSCRRNKQRLCR